MEKFNDKVLKDKDIYPDDNILKSTLGRSFNAYIAFLEIYSKNDMTYEWIYYKDAKEWLCKVQKKKKTIVWIAVREKFFFATIYFPTRLTDEILELNISNEVKERIRATENIGKLKPCVFEIKNKRALTDFEKVMNFKINSK